MAIISVEGVSKRYRKGVTGYRTLREDLYALTGSLVHLTRRSQREDDKHIWALRDVSFEVQPGEKVGIIGRNGCGKTTLLRLLAGITKPTKGKIEVRGRLGVLIELMAGFHPELTGRENIFLNGAIMGMSQKEIRRKLDEIVHFAGIEEFIDTPIKRYSSGMHVRLGFAVAAHLEPDVLLVDEVLAVGDAEFQKKCLGKMDEVAGEGRTVLFVSHNMGSVGKLCTRTIVLSKGRAIFDGPSGDAISAYLGGASDRRPPSIEFASDPDKPIAFRQAALLVRGKGGSAALDIADQLVLELYYSVRCDLQGTNVAFSLIRDGLVLFHSWDTDNDPKLLIERKKGEYHARIGLPRGLLAPGTYSITLAAGRVGIAPIIVHPECLSFELHNLVEDLTKVSHSRGAALMMNLAWETSCNITAVR